MRPLSKKRKSGKITALFLLLALLLIPLCGFRRASEYTPGGEQIRAAMYFGHEWQVNFWTCEHAEAAEDFERMRADGLNTVIFVVPWRAFQPGTAGGGQMDRSLLSRLDALMREAENAGLGVMLRIGYTWDRAGGESTVERYNALPYDKNLRTAWKNYAAAVYQTASSHANYVGAFLSWEDFWNYVNKVKGASEAGRYQEGKRIGYSDYVLSHYDAEELGEYYDNQRDIASAPLPTADSPAYPLFLEWYDHFLMDLLAETQEVFPELSFECRLHNDTYYTADGEARGYAHTGTYDAAEAPYTSVMLSVDMGAVHGSSSASVADADAGILSMVSAVAGKPVFVDQFLYQETTPGYDQIAQISDSVNSYLSRMRSVFAGRSIGYGLWTYRDYADNILANPEFGFGTEHWLAANAAVENHDGNHMMRIRQGGSITQDLGGMAYLSNKPTRLRLRVIAENDGAILTVSVGGKTLQETIPAGDQVVELAFDSSLKDRLQISSSREILVDDIKLYSHITEGGIYDIDGNPGPYLSGLHSLNGL